jgi:acyl-coenzyme A synthetase/AMP-(fatty) acid ligase
VSLRKVSTRRWPVECVEHVLVVRRTGIDVPWTDGRDLWWDETVPQAR